MFNILIASPRKQKHKGHFCWSLLFIRGFSRVSSRVSDETSKCPNFKSFLLLSSKSEISIQAHIVHQISLIKSHLCHPCQLQDIWAESNQISWTKKEQLLSNTVFLWDGWQNLHRYKIMSSSIFTCWALHQQSLCSVNVDPQTVCEQGIWEP